MRSWSAAARRCAITAYSRRSTAASTALRIPRGSRAAGVLEVDSWNSGWLPAAISRRKVSLSRWSSLPGAGVRSIPKTPLMITSSVTACIRGASANASPTASGRSRARRPRRSSRRSAATASPWNGGSSSLRWRMWRAPTEVSTEFGPRIGRSGDSPVSDGASSRLGREQRLDVVGVGGDDERLLAREQLDLPHVAVADRARRGCTRAGRARTPATAASREPPARRRAGAAVSSRRPGRSRRLRRMVSDGWGRGGGGHGTSVYHGSPGAFNRLAEPPPHRERESPCQIAPPSSPEPPAGSASPSPGCSPSRATG